MQQQAISTTQARVACDGGGGALGHPKTYYSFGDKQQVTCSYCGQIFVRKDNG